MQVRPRDADRLEADRGERRIRLVVEQPLTQPAERLLARASRPLYVGMQEVGTQLDVEPGPARLMLSGQLNRKINCLEQEGIPPAPTGRPHLCPQPVGAMGSTLALSKPRGRLGLPQLSIHRLAHSCPRGETDGIQSGQQHDHIGRVGDGWELGWAATWPLEPCPTRQRRQILSHGVDALRIWVKNGAARGPICCGLRGPRSRPRRHKRGP